MDLTVRILLFFFLVHAVLAVKQPRDIITAGDVDFDNAEHAVGIRRKRGWIKDVIDETPKLVKGTGKVINWFQVRRGKRILLQDARLHKFVSSSFVVYRKAGGLQRAHKDFYMTVRKFTSIGTVQEGRIGKHDLVILNEKNPYCIPTPCQTIELYTRNSSNDGWNAVIVLYNKVDTFDISYHT